MTLKGKTDLAIPQDVPEGSDMASIGSVGSFCPEQSPAARNEIIDAPVAVIPSISDAFTLEENNREVIDGKKHSLAQMLKTNSSIRWLVLFCLLVVAGSIVLASVLTVLSMPDSTESSNSQQREFAIKISGSDAFKTPESPQSKALNWMLKEDKLKIPLNEYRFTQRYVSALLYFCTGGSTSWIPNTTVYLNANMHECEWDEWDLLPAERRNGTERKYVVGLHCDDDNLVTRMNMYHLNMSGTIPAEIGSLSHLGAINFGGNKYMGGTVPTALGKLNKLKELWLFDMNLTGAIPAQLKNLTNLETFSIYSNSNLMDDMQLKVCSLPKLVFFQSDCGNGTKFPICSCCNNCCNPRIKKCCIVNGDYCYTTDANTAPEDDDWWEY